MVVSSVNLSISHHIKKYYHLLRTSDRLRLTSLYPTYFQMHSVMHKQASHQDFFDYEAFTYAINRLPIQIIDTGLALFCKDENDLKDHNIDLSSWQTVTSNARRRSTFFNPQTRQLLFFVNSKSDIDDIINCLLAFQIEWNKLPKLIGDKSIFITNESFDLLGIDQNIWQKIKTSLGTNWQTLISQNFSNTDIFVKKLKSKSTYQQVCTTWWQNNQNRFLVDNFSNLPLYFVSSNSHSLVNIIGGYVNQIQDKVFTYINEFHPHLYQDWQNASQTQNQLRINDLLYYCSSLFFTANPIYLDKMADYHQQLGIKTFSLGHTIPVKIQLIPLNCLTKSNFVDPFINKTNLPQDSSAYIVNVNYPLGFMAHYLLNSFLENKTNIKGIYVVGKAAILSGDPGDMQIPSTVFDERTNNIFTINNYFNNQQFHPNLVNIHQNQKAITVYGTFLENLNQLQSYQKSNFNIIEMESSPYLLSIAKFFKNIDKPRSLPINLSDLKIDLGIINYASDNPLNQTLGASNLGIRGIESTYLSILSVLQRIIDLESS